MTIREARPDDFPQLWRIDQLCYPPGIAYSRAELAYYMSRRGAFTLVAEMAVEGSGNQPDARKPGTRSGPRTASPKSGSGAASRIAGFIVAERNRHGTGHIITIDVRPEARRAGTGSTLMAAAEERLRALRCEAIFLEAAVDNPAALAFYNRHGYAILRTIPRYYMNSVDALLLEKKLE